MDDAAKKHYENPNDAKGFFTILGDQVKVKALMGGTGLYELPKANPFLQWSVPIGIGSTIGFNYFKHNNDGETK